MQEAGTVQCTPSCPWHLLHHPGSPTLPYQSLFAWADTVKHDIISDNLLVHLKYRLPGPDNPEHNILEHGHSKGKISLIQATQHLLEVSTVQVTRGEEILLYVHEIYSLRNLVQNKEYFKWCEHRLSSAPFNKNW